MLPNLTVAADFNATQTYTKPTSWMTIFYIIILLYVETMGNFLLVCMVLYQKYGVAEMQKTVNSHLSTSICLAMILNNVFIIPLTLIYITSSQVSK